MALHGKQLIGSETTAAVNRTFHGSNPATGQQLEPAYHESTLEEVDRAMRLAATAFDDLRRTTPDQRAAFLEAIAEGIMAAGDALLQRAHDETGLPMQRCTAERGRTVNQTKMFAAMLREGSWVEARIDTGEPSRQPLPKPDVRTMRIGIGPVVVFGASNFPFAISVAGTDTTTALAAGCPVVVKAHPAHPGTCEILGEVIRDAVKRSGMPEGTFSMLHGVSHEVGLALVKHPATKAVAFTGSLRGGRALFDAAAARPEPIPVYAEMGSTNPLFVLPGALRERADQIAAGYIASVTMGVGQFCTNPGVVLGLRDENLQRFIDATAKQAAAAAPGTMLHKGIAGAYGSGVERIRATSGVKQLAVSAAAANSGKCEAACTIFTTDAANLRRHEHLMEEVFGPSSIIVDCADVQQMYELARDLDGHLTATIHGTDADLAEHAELVHILQKKVGRLIFNGFPTGIEVCNAMHHSGPYPATTDPHFTSIGPWSIYRFARPVCFQGFPDAALPPELRNANPRKIWRIVDNQRTREPITIAAAGSAAAPPAPAFTGKLPS